MGEYETIIHPYGPIWDENSKILILGTIASVKSRENKFFYGHPQNRFWKVLAAITNTELPTNPKEKTDMLLNNQIALWDIIYSCEIIGSDDNSIRNVVPNDFTEIIEGSNIKKIYTNGKKADSLYKKLCEKNTNIKGVYLPSTSPANATWSLLRLVEFWGKAIEL